MVEVAGYLPFKNADQARTLATRLEQEVSKLGKTIWYPEEFMNKADNYTTQVAVNLNKPLSGTQCTFEVSTQDFAKNAGHMVSKKSQDGLIALTFYCSDESREEYFPIRK